MEITSTCRLPISSILWQRAPGTWVQTIVCKATFDLVPGEAKLAERQEPIHTADRPWDDDPARSPYAPGDLAPLKALADVLLVGRAFAPGGRPVRSLVARLIVGDMEKAVEVFGPRAWNAAGQLHDGAPFTSASLAYERAAGGPDTWNPVGIPLDGPPDARGNTALPHLQPLDQTLVQRGDFLAPIGFGPIAPSWPLRAHLLGRQRGAPSPARLLEHPLSPDLDKSYFNAAPPDQQADEIRADERLILENLHPDHARLVTRLPGLRPRAWVELPGTPIQKVRLLADTLWIDTNRAIATVTWRGQVPLRRQDEAGRVVIGLDEPPAEGAGERRTELFADPAETADVGETLPLDARSLRTAALPFSATTPREPEVSRAPEVFRAPFPPPLVPIAPVPTAPFLTLVRDVAPPPPVTGSVGASKDPALAGVLAASNAAAGTGAKAEKPPAEAVPGPAPKAAREAPREVLELLWYDPAALPRIRRNLAWKKIISELKPRPSDDDFDGGLPPDQMKAAKDRRDVFGVLARGEVMDMEGIRRAMEMAVLEDGSFVPPYVLTAGVLEFLFDEHETLKATLVAVAPFVPLDKKLKETVDYVNEVMKTPGIERARGVVTGLCERVKAAFGQTGRGVPAGYLEETVEEMLVEGRCWQKRIAAGRTWIPATTMETMTAHLPEDLERDIPMPRRFKAKFLGEARSEARLLSLQIVALGRLNNAH